MPLLTIGIPTFNRYNSVLQLIQSIIKHTPHDAFETLVIDDGSSDGTFDALDAHPAFPKAGIRILKNPANLGYTHTFIRMFEECKTEYLMMMADDDVLILSNLSPLIKYLEVNTPDFVSPQFLSESKIYRGKKYNKSIKPIEFFPASAHAPGLIYRVSACKESLGLLKSRADAGRADALVYPQVVVLICLVKAARSCHWLPLPTVTEGDAMPSGVRDLSGNAYSSFESRWQQLKDFDDLLAAILAENNSKVTRALVRAHRERVFGHLVLALQNDRPEMRSAFDERARRFYLKQIVKRLLKIS